MCASAWPNTPEYHHATRAVKRAARPCRCRVDPLRNTDTGLTRRGRDRVTAVIDTGTARTVRRPALPYTAVY